MNDQSHSNAVSCNTRPRGYLFWPGAIPLLLALAAAFVSPLLIVLVFLGDWLLAVYLLWSSKRIEPERLFSGRNQFALLELSLALSLLQILIVFPLVFLRLLVVSVPNLWAASLAIIAFFLIVVFTVKQLWPIDCQYNVIDRNSTIGFAITVALAFGLDLYFLFPYELLPAVALPACLVTLNVYRKVIAGLAHGRVERKFKNRLWLFQFTIWAALFAVTMNFSAIGNFAFFDGKSGYTLEKSDRAGINSLGFRNQEFPPTPEPNKIRIVALGDSFTYGWLVPPQNSYPGVLQTLFNESAVTTPVEIVNGGIPSYNLQRMTASLAGRVLPLRPQLVILLTGGNDLRLLYRDQLRDKLDEFIRIARNGGAKVILCNYPFLPADDGRKTAALGSINEIVAQTARESGTGFVDFFAVLRDDRSNFLIDGHPSARGYQVMAQAMFDYLQSNRTLPGN